MPVKLQNFEKVLQRGFYSIYWVSIDPDGSGNIFGRFFETILSGGEGTKN